MKPDEIDLTHYKLLIFDIDSTILPRGGHLHPFTLEVLQRLRERGFTYTLATGKNLPSAKVTADELGIDIPLILSNGALIENRFGEVLARTTLPETITQNIMRICAEWPQDLVLYIGDGLYFLEMTENLSKTYGKVPFGLHAVGDWQAIAGLFPLANKCVAVDHTDYANLIALEQKFKEHVNGKTDVLFTCPQLLEVVPKGVDKASGLRELAGLLGIRMDEVMAFGDYDNDATMLAAAGLGVAVANASPAAIASADLVIGSCDENGPAVFLNLLLDTM
jgi:Cof subfamily protein (haloacid dehalogenase superfamily)